MQLQVHQATRHALDRHPGSVPQTRQSRVQEAAPYHAAPPSDKTSHAGSGFVERPGLRAVTYSYLTRLKAAATWEGLSRSKLQEISQRGKEEEGEIGIKRYRGAALERRWGWGGGGRAVERISNKSSPNHVSKKKILCTPLPNPAPPLPQPPSPSLPARVFQAPRGMSGERVLEKFVSGKGWVAV